LGFFLTATASFCTDAYLVPVRFQKVGFTVAVIFTVLITLVLAVANPKLLSIVEGTAGDVGYDW
jgi:hypothetical protein